MMKNIFVKSIGFLKTYKKKIIAVISISLLIVIIAAGTAFGVVRSKAKSNEKYTQEQLQKVALGKVPGEAIKVEKELNFEDAVYVYEFDIKDKENMLQTVKVESKNGVILRVNNEQSKHVNEKGHGEHNNEHGED